MLYFGLHTFDHSIAVVILASKVEFRDRTMAFDADVNQVCRVRHAPVHDLVGHTVSVAASLAKRRMRRGHGLHVASNADIRDDGTVRAAGNDFAVGDGVNSLNHVASRAIMRAKAGTAGPSRKA